MKSGLFILPFISIFVSAIFAVMASSFADLAVVFNSIGGGLAIGLIALWIWLDRAGFRKVFGRKGAKYGASSGAVLLLTVLVFIGISVITNRPRFDKTFDLSRDKSNSLSDQSLKAIETLNQSNTELAVKAYFLDQAQEASFRDLIGLYLAKGAKLKISYINPQKDPTQAMADKLTAANTAIFELAARENRITTFTEEKITNALIAVLKANAKKIYFTTGHGEGALTGQDSSSFEVIVQELKNNRYEVATVNLMDKGEVPSDATALVIAGPKYDLKAAETKAIENFVGKGGSVLTLVDALTPTQVLNTTLSKYGLSYNRDFMVLRPDDPRAQMLGQNNAIIGEFDELSPVTKDFAKKTNVNVIFQNTRSVSEITDNISKFKVSLIGKTTGSTTVKVANVSTAEDLKHITAERIVQGSFAVMGSATGKVGEKEVRVAVYGSSQFATNQGVQSAENRDLMINTMSWLTQDDDFIAIRPKDSTKSTLALTSGASMLGLLFISYIYPFLFLGFGGFYWVRRKRA